MSLVSEELKRRMDRIGEMDAVGRTNIIETPNHVELQVGIYMTGASMEISGKGPDGDSALDDLLRRFADAAVTINYATVLASQRER